MAIEFQQTDDAAICAAAAFCSADSLNGDKDTRQAIEGGTAGVTAVTTTLDASAADLLAVWFEIDPDDSYDWDAGDYTVRLNITTGNHQLTWDTLYICRVNSACVSQATIASATGLAKNLANAGVQEHTLAGAAQTPAAGDKIMVILGFDNAQTMANDLVWLPDQLVTTPLVTGAGPQTISPTGIASTLVIGAIQQLARTLEGLTGIASGLAFGSPTMTLRIAPGGIASGEAHGSPQLNQAIAPTGVASTEALGSPQLNQNITPAGVASTLTFGTPTVTLSGVTISPDGIASGLAFGTPTMQPGPVTISPSGVASGLGFGSATIVLTIEPSGLASALAFGTPTVTLGAMAISPSGIASGLAFGTPTVTVAISPAGILSGYVEFAVSLAGTVTFATVLVGKAE